MQKSDLNPPLQQLNFFSINKKINLHDLAMSVKCFFFFNCMLKRVVMM